MSPRARGSLERLSAAAAVCIALVLAASCHRQSGREAHVTVGTFWGGAAAESLQRELIGIADDMGPVSIDLRTFTLASLDDYLFRSQPLVGGRRLDLVIVPNDWLGRLWQRRLLVELPPQRVEQLQQRLVRQALLAVRDGEHVLAYPVCGEALALVYDPERFPSPPASLDDVLHAPLPAGVQPLALNLSSPYYLAPLVSSYQGFLLDLSGAFTWREDVVQRVLERLRPAWGTPLGWRICRGSDVESLQLQLFEDGRLASFLAGPWLLPALEAGGHPFAVVPVPPFADSPHPARALVGYQCAAVANGSPWADVALDIAARLCSSPVNERLNLATRRLPVLLDSYRTEQALTSGGTMGFLRALEEGQFFPASSRWSQGSARVASELRRLTLAASPPGPAELERTLRSDAP